MVTCHICKILLEANVAKSEECNYVRDEQKSCDTCHNHTMKTFHDTHYDTVHSKYDTGGTPR